jgi:8-oxo-dGTP pyrophosphatase MutT (NUDIX family)
MVVQPRLAAAVMLLRDNNVGLQVFMVRRSLKSEFMPDVYVFPGGTVCSDDRVIESRSELCRHVTLTSVDPEGRTLLGNGIRVAALRELFEEANILLAYTSDHTVLALDEQSLASFTQYRQAFNERRSTFSTMLFAEQLTLATDELIYFSHWITPERLPRRYDTHFFLAQAPRAQEAIFDQFETSDGVWIRPEEALQRSEQGTFPLSFPTLYQLRELVDFADVSSALATAMQHYVVTYRPFIREKDGKEHIMLPDDSSSLL